MFKIGGPEERLFGARLNLKNYPANVAFINARLLEHTMSNSAVQPSRCGSADDAPSSGIPAKLLRRAEATPAFYCFWTLG